MEEYWFTCKKFTVWVKVKEGLVVETSPICRKFVGQSFFNLKRWASKFGGMKYEKL